MNKKTHKQRMNLPENFLYPGRFVYLQEGEGLVSEALKKINQEAAKKEQEKAAKKEGGVPMPAPGETKEGEEEKGMHLNFPSRSPDAMTGTEFTNAWGNCGKSHECRQKLMMTQAAEGAFSPDTLEPRIYETEVNGIKVKIPIYQIKFGTKEDNVTVTPDAQTFQAMADMLNGHLMPAKLCEKLYSDPSVKKIPFIDGKMVETWMRRKGMNPAPIHVRGANGKPQMNGDAMISAEYMKAEHDMQEEWKQKHGIGPTELTIGGRKTVLMPRDNGNSRLTFGGALSSVPTGDGDYRITGNVIQRIGSMAHSTIYHDYSADGLIVGPFIDVGGQKVATKTVFRDPQYKDVKDALFGVAKESKYKYKKWMGDIVDQYRQDHPPSEAPAPPRGADRVAQAPEPGITGKPEETPPSEAPAAQPVPSAPPPSGGGGGGGYAAPSGYAPPTETAPPPAPSTPPPEPKTEPDKTPEDVEVQNKNKVIVLGDSLSTGAGPLLGLKNVQSYWKVSRHATEMLGIFRNLPDSQCKGATLYLLGGSNDLFSNKSIETITNTLKEIYKLAKKRNMKIITGTLPPIGNSKEYEARSPHNEEQLRKRWDAINNWIMKKGKTDEDGKSIDPDKIIPYHTLFADPSDKYIMRSDVRAPDGVHMTPKGYKEMAKYVRDEAMEFEQPDSGKDTRIA